MRRFESLESAFAYAKRGRYTTDADWDERDHPRTEGGQFAGKSGETLAQIKTECFEYAKSHFCGKSFLNSNTGYKIEVSRRGLDEWVSKSKSLEQILSIKHLDKIIENATYNHSSKNIHSENSPITFDYYDCPVEIKGEKFNAVLSVKSIKEGKGKNEVERKIYHHHFLDDIKIEPVSSSLCVDKTTATLLLTDSFCIIPRRRADCNTLAGLWESIRSRNR